MTRHIRGAALLLFILCAAVPLVFAFAQEIPSLPAARTAAQLATICQTQKNLAASNARPDIENTIARESGLVLTDSCVAAILNPLIMHPNPANPESYMCVGKRSRIGVSSLGLIQDFNIPDISVPVGTCATMACTDYTNLSPSCIAADKPTSLSSEILKFINWVSSVTSPAGGGTVEYPVSIGIRG